MQGSNPSADDAILFSDLLPKELTMQPQAPAPLRSTSMKHQRLDKFVVHDTQACDKVAEDKTVIALSRGDFEELLTRTVQNAVDTTMGRFAKSIKAVLEELTKRIDGLSAGETISLEIKECIQQSVEELKGVLKSQSETANNHFGLLELSLKEVERGVQALRDKHELIEAHLQLAKLTSKGPEPSASAKLMECTEVSSIPDDNHEQEMKNVQAVLAKLLSAGVLKDSAVDRCPAVLPASAPSASSEPQQQMPVDSTLSTSTPAHAAMAAHTYSQHQYHIPRTPAPPSLAAIAHQSHTLLTPTASQYSALSSPSPYAPSHSAPPPPPDQQYGHVAQRPPPPMASPPAMPVSQPGLTYAPQAFGYPAAAPVMYPPAVPQASAPPARPAVPPAVPARTSSSAVPLEQVITDIANMGFRREKVMSVIHDMQVSQQQLDMNVILDRLMRGL